MIDSTNNNSTNGLATALRDRASNTIPTQPNRSLPVRPAPHIPCRSHVSKRMNKKIDVDQTQSETVSNNIQNKKRTSTVSETPVELSSGNIDLQQSSSLPSSSSSLRSANHSLIRINVPNWQNEVQLPIINIIEVSKNKKSNEENNEKKRSTMGRLGIKRKSTNSIDNGNINCNFIDITKSPERYLDFSINIDSSSSNCSKSDSIILDDDDDGDDGGGDGDDRRTNTTPKKRRRRKERKSSNNNVSQIKIVPPLRLKKIQCLQEKNTTNCSIDNWSNVQESINIKDRQESTTDVGFQYYQPNLSPKEEIVQDNTPPTVDDWPNEYRIVSGQTPPYTIDIQNQSPTNSNHDNNKLYYHQQKLQMKLRELKKKTFELGREMIKTAFTSPNNSMQETIDSYKKQIETLNNLLEKLPQTEINNDIAIQISESPVPTTIVSSSSLMTSTTHTSVLPYCDSSQSPSPPKLSPKMTIDSRIIKSPDAIRNSPPLLPRINSINDEKCHNWIDSDYPKKSTTNNYEISCSASVTTTSECLIDEEIDIDDKPELLDLALNEIIKSDNKLEATEKNHDESNKNSFFTNSNELIINTNKNVIDKFTNQNDRITSPKISSSCDTPQSPRTKQSTSTDNNNITTVEAMENNLIIDNQFPSLRSWLTNSLSANNIKNFTTNITNIKESEKLNTCDNELSITQQTGNEDINQVHKINTQPVNSRNKNISEQNTNHEGSHWNNEQQWQNQIHRPTHISQNSTPNPMNISIEANQFCQPMPLAGLYTRNYPFQFQIDPCGPYNYNHPTNAASTPSLWNNTIIEYPLIRTQNISNRQLTEMKTNTNIPQQHNIPVSTANSSSLQNITPSTYCHFSPSTPSQDGIAKTMSINDSTNSKLPLTNFPKRNDYPTSSPLHSIIFPTSANPTGNQLIHPLTSQENFYRYHPQAYMQKQVQQRQPSVRYAEGFPEATHRLPIHDRPISQMNYRPLWRGPVPPSTSFPSNNNYGMRSNWPLDPCNLLSTLSPAILQNYTTALNMGVPINMRGTKERVNQLRNCDTPHLGKVEYNSNTSRTLECSNCGRPDPTFKCLGCEMTFYCDEACQARHWNRHVVSCPKKMPKLKKVGP